MVTWREIRYTRSVTRGRYKNISFWKHSLAMSPTRGMQSDASGYDRKVFVGALFLMLSSVLALPLDDRWRIRSSALFACSFTTDTCGMRNQDSARAEWIRKYISFGNKRGYAMVINGNQANNHVARLLTPTFSTEEIGRSCLGFKYYIKGMSSPSLSVIKQGFVTQYIFVTAYNTKNAWAEAKIDVDLLGDEVLFYFEADTKVEDYSDSTVAITDIHFSLEPCNSFTK